MKKVIDVSLRIIAFPFLAPVFMLFMIRLWLIYCKNFLMYGGEMVTYQKKMQFKTIQDSYEKIVQYIDKNSK